jgi:hypothetical protein
MNITSSLAGVAAVSAMVAADVIQAAPLETRTENVSLALSITPLVTTAEKYPANTVYWPCPLESRGTAPDSASPGFHRVGWTHIYDEGSAPAPCKYRLNHVQRVITAVDLSPIEKHRPSAFVDSAKLSFDKKRVAGDHDCADRFLTVIEGDAPIPPRVEERWELPVPRLGSGDCAGSRCTVEVKGQVNEWLQGKVANRGLALIGDQERLDANDNVSCVTEYGNFKLDVVYRHDVPAGTMIVPILPGAIKLLRRELTVTLVRRASTEAVYDLRWTGASPGPIEIVRDGTSVTTVDDGSERVRAPFGTVRFKVCKGAICSNEVTVTS